MSETLTSKFQGLVTGILAVPPEQRGGVDVVHIDHADVLELGTLLGCDMTDPFEPVVPPDTTEGGESLSGGGTEPEEDTLS